MDILSEATDLVQRGKLTERDINDVVKYAQMTPLTRAVQRITNADDLLDVWDKSAPDERDEIHDLISKKLASVYANRPGQWTDRLVNRINNSGIVEYVPRTQVLEKNVTEVPPGVEVY